MYCQRKDGGWKVNVILFAMLIRLLFDNRLFIVQRQQSVCLLTIYMVAQVRRATTDGQRNLGSASRSLEGRRVTNITGLSCNQIK